MYVHMDIGIQTEDVRRSPDKVHMHMHVSNSHPVKTKVFGSMEAGKRTGI